MSTFSNYTLPNPFTPLAFLPPELAKSSQLATFLQMIAFGVFLLDIFTNIGSDYEIIVRHKVKLPTLVYFISRLSTMAWVITATIIMGMWYPYPEESDYCNADTQWTKFKGGADINCVQAGTVTTSLISSLRVRAIYNEKKPVQRFFLTMWIFNVMGDALSFLVITMGQSPSIPIKICAFIAVRRKLIAIAFFMRLLHDSLVFFAISYRLWRLSEVIQDYRDRDPENKRLWDRICSMLFSGNNMPPFSRLLLKDGQLYYLISTLSIVAVVVLVFMPGVDDNYLAFALNSNLGLFNCMAGYVFRDVKLGRIREETISDSYQANH
ncbi:hypothetical protein K435DRAFT_748322 [Dendrothele bispora CBS 962.96]|uniref:Uncharacterized protein n=1 Tax=Dendrothele bispora (strain CBS 962.96) TaxID=1314807 RepID=A0A4S8MKG8_DENBC|nr:hypothetical protein K435DRAFT_748322 [Dendrothele bispora CBS 962.96]